MEMHDYNLSAEELRKKSKDTVYSAKIIAHVSFECVEIKDFQKAHYFNLLATLKNSFNYPYDSKIQNAENLAAKNEFKDANNLLLNIVSGYTHK